MELLNFITIYSILTISILGYGFLFSKVFTKYNNFQYNSISIGYIGIFGIFFFNNHILLNKLNISPQ